MVRFSLKLHIVKAFREQKSHYRKREKLEDSESRIGILDYKTSQSCGCLKPAEKAYCQIYVTPVEVNQQQAAVSYWEQDEFGENWN